MRIPLVVLVAVCLLPAALHVQSRATKSSPGPTADATPIVVDPNASVFFQSLVPQAWKAFSLRPRAGEPSTSPYYEKQLERRKDGGYAARNGVDVAITYSPSTDTDPNAQDAAKVVIPAFSRLKDTGGLGALQAAIDATATTFILESAAGGLYTTRRRSILVDDEIMDIEDPDGRGPLLTFDRTTGVIFVKRGAHGTTAAPHAAGTLARLSINTVPNALRLPLGTEDGHTYFFTWDGFWTDSYVKSGLTNHKTFNFISRGIWLEPNTNFTGGTGAAKASRFNRETDVAAYQHRSYNRLGGPAVWDMAHENYLGPTVTSFAPLAPQLATFVIKPNRWIRFFVQLEQRANDYDYLDVWIADRETGPVQILKRIPVSVRRGTISEFVFEFNTSTDLFVRGNLRDLVSYVRNFVALRDAGDVTGLLKKPE
jgi:hypothetical protein